MNLVTKASSAQQKTKNSDSEADSTILINFGFQSLEVIKTIKIKNQSLSGDSKLFPFPRNKIAILSANWQINAMAIIWLLVNKFETGERHSIELKSLEEHCLRSLEANSCNHQNISEVF